VHPASGRAVWHLATTVSIELFSVDLEAFAQQVGAGPTKQIVLVLDGAGWHDSPRVRVPKHVHLLFLPPHSPELQPAEHLWPLTNTVLVNRHFASIEELEDAQAERCVALQARPDLIGQGDPVPLVAQAHRQAPRSTGSQSDRHAVCAVSAGASGRAQVARCSRTRLAAWWGDRRQRSGATRYRSLSIKRWDGLFRAPVHPNAHQVGRCCCSGDAAWTSAGNACTATYRYAMQEPH
jgi:DDE superfamily endonuclease